MEPELEHWKQVEQLYQAALERAESERLPFLAQACSGDEALRREVESLLVHHGDAASFLESPAVDDVAKALAHGEERQSGGDSVSEDVAPKSVGPYHLLKKLGEGGMGQVWLAEQTAPLRRQVALKLIRAGLYDRSLLQRFQAERQSLAIMDHPAIAKVFDAGATPEGQPYFVMEYVPGLPVTTYCDEKRLKIRDRLELFIKVCEGVQHAHQKAIIHRDLKPANILVVEVDGKATPRIIDFGLAKAASRQPGADLSVTWGSGFVGTPGYMSPEQADPSTQDIDTRTDVYSLGVVLYVLLTGALPFDPKQPLEEVLRHLREDDPLRPSTKVSTDREALTAAAEMRQTEPRQLVSQLRGDLDSITMKALEKERDRRYGTPAGLAADIGRYLRHEPVVARPASAGYRARKYVRRHGVGVAIATGLVLLLAAFSVVQAAQLRRITRERDRANRITDFMTNMFKVSDPSEARGNSITAREILDKASKDINAGLARDPEMQAQMMQVMGTVYENLGLYPRAQSLLEPAVDIRRRALGPEHPATLDAKRVLGTILSDEGHFAEAEKVLREIMESQRRVLGAENQDTLTSMNELAATLQAEGHYAEAEKILREAFATQRREFGPDDPRTIVSMRYLGWTLQQQGHYPEAEKLQRQGLEIGRRVLGPDHPEIMGLLGNLGWTLIQEGHYSEAEKLLREDIEIQRRVLGPEHPEALVTLSHLGVALNGEGRFAEAEKVQRETLSVQTRVLGPEHLATLFSAGNLAMTFQGEHHWSDAEKLQRQTLEIESRVMGLEDPSTLSSMVNLAATLGEERHLPEAENLLRKALDTYRRVLGPDYPTAAYDLACIRALKGDPDEALALLREAVDHGLPADAKAIEEDPDLNSLHGDPRFAAFLSYARQHSSYARLHAVEAQKPK